MWPFRRNATQPADVRVLWLAPDDRLVIETRERITKSQAHDIKASVVDSLGIDADRVIVVANATLSVLREGEPPPPPVILSPGRP